MHVSDEPFDYREIIDEANVLASLKKVGFSDNDAAMVFDIAVNAANKATESFRLAIEVSDNPMVTIQAAIVGTQFMATGSALQAQSMVDALRGIGAKLMIQNEDGSVRSA